MAIKYFAYSIIFILIVVAAIYALSFAKLVGLFDRNTCNYELKQTVTLPEQYGGDSNSNFPVYRFECSESHGWEVRLINKDRNWEEVVFSLVSDSEPEVSWNDRLQIKIAFPKSASIGRQITKAHGYEFIYSNTE